MTALRIPLATLLAVGLMAAAVACSSEEPPVSPAESPSTATASVAQHQEQGSPTQSATIGSVATTAPALAATVPSVSTAPAAATQAASPAAQAQQPAAPADAATSSPPATAEPTAPAAEPPKPTQQSSPPSNTPLPTPTEAPTAIPMPTASRPAAPEGTNVGERPPAFAMNLVDGTRLASADLAATGRPVFMHYFATW